MLNIQQPTDTTLSDLPETIVKIGSGGAILRRQQESGAVAPGIAFERMDLEREGRYAG